MANQDDPNAARRAGTIRARGSNKNYFAIPLMAAALLAVASGP